jgi:hypothetical protein
MAEQGLPKIKKAAGDETADNWLKGEAGWPLSEIDPNVIDPDGLYLPRDPREVAEEQQDLTWGSKDLYQQKFKPPFGAVQNDYESNIDPRAEDKDAKGPISKNAAANRDHSKDGERKQTYITSDYMNKKPSTSLLPEENMSISQLEKLLEEIEFDVMADSADDLLFNARTSPISSSISAEDYDSALDDEEQRALDTFEHAQQAPLPKEGPIEDILPRPVKVLTETGKGGFDKFFQENPEAYGKDPREAFSQYKKWASKKGIEAGYWQTFQRQHSKGGAAEAFGASADMTPEPMPGLMASELEGEFGDMLAPLSKAAPEMLSAEMTVDEKYSQLLSKVYDWATNPMEAYERDASKKTSGSKRHLMICGSPGIGKEQPHSAKILTPQGWVSMGAIRVGDIVCTPDNKTAKVVNKFPQGVKPVYEITLKDGRKARAGLEHLWKVKDYQQREQVLQTGDLIASTEEGYTFNNGGVECSKWLMPFVSPIEFSKKELPIDPYALGLLLGDGGLSASAITFTTTDPELLVSLVEGLNKTFTVEARKASTEIDFRIVSLAKQGRTTEINDTLRSLGLKKVTSDRKFIPEQYKWSTIQDRLDILSGLVDTDGYIPQGSGAYTQITTVSKRLCEDIIEIVQGLGGRASHRSKPGKYKLPDGSQRICKEAYTITFSLPAELPAPSKLTRKRERYGDRQIRTWQALTNIELVGFEESSCIMLDSEEHLYITDNYVVTHNTFSVKEATLKAVGEGIKFKTQYVRGTIGKSISNVMAFLYKFRQGYLIIFDDCDDFLDSDLGNIMKGVFELDAPSTNTGSVGVRKMAAKNVLDLEDQPLEEGATIRNFLNNDLMIYNEAFGDDGDEEEELEREGMTDLDTGDDEGQELLPARINFQSRILFISNKKRERIDSAVRSRLSVVELYLTPQEILGRIRDIFPQLLKNETSVPKERLDWAKTNALRWLELTVKANGRPIEFPGGRAFQLPFSADSTVIEFRTFIDLVSGWLSQARKYEREHKGFDLMSQQKLPMDFLRGFLMGELVPILKDAASIGSGRKK